MNWPRSRIVSNLRKHNDFININLYVQARRIWDLTDDSDLDERVSSYGGGLILYDMKTIQPVVPMVEQIRMLHHSIHYQEGWFNDEVILEVIKKNRIFNLMKVYYMHCRPMNLCVFCFFIFIFAGGGGVEGGRNRSL